MATGAHSAEHFPDPEVLKVAQSTGYANRFQATHRMRAWRPALVSSQGARLHPGPTVHGVHSALVVGPSGESTPSGADEL